MKSSGKEEKKKVRDSVNESNNVLQMWGNQ